MALVALIKLLLAYLLCALGLVLRCCCRRRLRNDPRAALRAAKIAYVYAVLHGDHLLAALVHDEPQVCTMLSRSRDGDLLLPLLRYLRVNAVRGSSRRDQRDKGGKAALSAIAAQVGPDCPAILAVDGPKGPQGHVKRGIITLARQCNLVILPVGFDCPWALRLWKNWDKMAIPWPGALITATFAAPIFFPPNKIYEPAIYAKVQTALHGFSECNSSLRHLV